MRLVWVDLTPFESSRQFRCLTGFIHSDRGVLVIQIVGRLYQARSPRHYCSLDCLGQAAGGRGRQNIIISCRPEKLDLRDEISPQHLDHPGLQAKPSRPISYSEEMGCPIQTTHGNSTPGFGIAMVSNEIPVMTQVAYFCEIPLHAWVVFRRL